MFLTRVPGFGNTTNLNLDRKRRRRGSTSPAVARRRRPSLEALETRQLLSTYAVTKTGDNGGINPLPNAGTGTLRQAIVNADASSSPADIVFNIPASTSADYEVPVPGFDPTTQTWRITLQSPLPADHQHCLDRRVLRAPVGVKFRYPSQVSLAVQSLTVLGSPTGGSFTLSTLLPLPAGTTGQIPYNANAATVQAALEEIIGQGNVTVTGGPAPDTQMTITFGGAYARQTLPNLQWTGNLTGGTNPGFEYRDGQCGWNTCRRSRLHPVDPEHSRRPAGK